MKQQTSILLQIITDNYNEGSGGSLNTFENLLELFAIVFRFSILIQAEIKSLYFDIYHCIAGSGKAQVTETIA